MNKELKKKKECVLDSEISVIGNLTGYDSLDIFDKFSTDTFLLSKNTKKITRIFEDFQKWIFKYLTKKNQKQK